MDQILYVMRAPTELQRHKRGPLGWLGTACKTINVVPKIVNEFTLVRTWRETDSGGAVIVSRSIESKSPRVALPSGWLFSPEEGGTRCVYTVLLESKAVLGIMDLDNLAPFGQHIADSLLRLEDLLTHQHHEA